MRKRARSELPPDLGPTGIDLRTGVVCVGARDVLIAFNVWLDAPVDVAIDLASRVRDPGRGVRALGFDMGAGRSQVSMNLTQPEEVGIDEAFDAVRQAAGHRVKIAATELIGVPPERFMPDPKREAARLLVKPGRSLEVALANDA